MLDFRIATFLQLCETRSYTKTARLLGMTQPSVTQHIKYLQNRYGCQLFRYEGKSLILTPEGEYLRRQAEDMMRRSRRVAADLQRMANRVNPLRFGIPSEFGDELAAQLLTALTAQYPEQVLSVSVGNSAELTAQVENGELDLVLTDKICAVPTLTALPTGKLAFGCYYAADGSVHGKQLLTRRLLRAGEGSADAAVMCNLLQKRQIAPDDFSAVWTIGSPAAMCRMAAAGQGICFAYALAAETYGGGKLQPVSGDLSDERTIVGMYRKENAELERIRELITQIRSVWTMWENPGA
ncbi:MAG: LysR family transcriptional regulator [Oscillospiraceae bacterium]|nr:LysR family transcriptional regulator [Oscillospiraceae bacterium]